MAPSRSGGWDESQCVPKPRVPNSGSSGQFSALTPRPSSPIGVGMNPAPIIPIIPVRSNDPWDDVNWVWELKLDGFRGLADTVRGRMLSKNGNRLRRFERLLDALVPRFPEVSLSGS